MDTTRMTWEDIKRAYPDEWVLLVDVDADPSIPRVRGGKVAGHSKSRKEVLASTWLPPGSGWALKYTGRPTGADLLPGQGHR
ncbi:MAG TPA: hypothetical protein VH877_23330 [Polyangia bacterium]|jgi:hypothetical protein|nr:hypothetical protein [Polyangia bacterium]